MKSMETINELFIYIMQWGFVVRVVLAILVLISGIFLSGLFSRRLKQLIRKHANLNAAVLVSGCSRVLLLALACLVSLAILGVPLYAVVTVFTGMLIAAGVTIRIPVPSLASGIMLGFVRPFTIGDRISCNGVVGTVTDIRLLFVTIKKDNEEVVMVPCEQFFNEATINLSAQEAQ